jgi:hypothetical protein
MILTQKCPAQESNPIFLPKLFLSQRKAPLPSSDANASPHRPARHSPSVYSVSSVVAFVAVPTAIDASTRPANHTTSLTAWSGFPCAISAHAAQKHPPTMITAPVM